MLPAAWCMLSGCFLLHAACRRLHFPRCMLHVVSYISPMDAACCQLCVAHVPVVVCGVAGRWIVSACAFFAACRTFSVACGLFSVARPSVPCRMPCALSAARPISHLVTLHVAWRTLPVACWLLSVACPVLHVVCCLLQSDTACCRVTQRVAE